MKLKIHPKTKKILNKILKINISKEKDLNIDLAKIADSLKYLEILLMTEKESRKKITNNKILKIKDINNLFNEKK
jgi:acyl carrier protein